MPARLSSERGPLARPSRPAAFAGSIIPVLCDEPSAQRLTPIERIVASRIDGRSSVDELVPLCGCSRQSFETALARLVFLDVVTLEEGEILELDVDEADEDARPTQPAVARA